jgi:hypothetical protein
MTLYNSDQIRREVPRRTRGSDGSDGYSPIDEEEEDEGDEGGGGGEDDDDDDDDDVEEEEEKPAI